VSVVILNFTTDFSLHLYVCSHLNLTVYVCTHINLCVLYTSICECCICTSLISTCVLSLYHMCSIPLSVCARLGKRGIGSGSGRGRSEGGDGGRAGGLETAGTSCAQSSFCASVRALFSRSISCVKGIICKLEHLWDIYRHKYTHSNTHLGGMVVDEISSDPRIISPVEVRPVNVVL
jgi:hypothetical protein